MNYYNKLTIDYSNISSEQHIELGAALIEAGFSIVDKGSDQTITVTSQNLQSLQEALLVAKEFVY